MRFEPCASKGQRKELITYDLEWKRHTYEISCCGIEDDWGYRAYRDIGALLGDLASRRKNVVAWAHWGGRFDFGQVGDYCKHNDIPLKAMLAGGSAIISTLWFSGRKVVLADTASIARTSAAYLGETIGVYKPAVDTDTDDWFVLTERNRIDCKIIRDWLGNAQEAVIGLGGELRMTAASTAMHLFRSQYMRSSVITNSLLNDSLRPFYFSSRVEPFISETTAREPFWRCYDVSSSFPWSMLGKLPGTLKEVSDRELVPTNETYDICECEISVPADCYLPPLPARGIDGRIFFPTGVFRGMYTEDDIELAREFGATVKISRTLRFGLVLGFADYARDLYELKRTAKDLSVREFIKILLNALYGKTGESETKQALFIPDRGGEIPPNARLISPALGGMPPVYVVTESVKVSHAHLPIAIAITSRSRALLARWLKRARRVAYCDTDSVHTTSELPEGSALGDLKLEYTYRKGTFISPKLYAVEHEPCERKVIKPVDGFYRLTKEQCPGWHVKSKGFSKLSLEQFKGLASGDTVAIERMSGIVATLKDGPRDIKFQKGLSVAAYCPKCYETGPRNSVLCSCGADMLPVSGSRPKRRPVGVESEPWAYRDIMTPWI